MKKLLFAAFAAIGILTMSSCSKDNANSGNETGDAKIRVSIKGEGSTRAITDPTQAEENVVKSFTVFVFNNNTGILEKSKTFTGVLEGEVDSLLLGSTKKVAVLVNTTLATTPANYTEFIDNLVDLDTQNPANLSTKGLFMSGEYPTPVTLVEGPIPTAIEIKVSRLVAKIRLASLKVIPDPEFIMDDFELLSVSIQRARDYAPVLGGLAAAGDFAYVGGIAGPVSTAAKTYLYEAYSLPAGYQPGDELKPDMYFYVFPNDNSGNNPTTITFHGKYEGKDMYYGVKVNDVVATATGATTDGTWIKRNHIYTMYVTLKKLGLGGDDPDKDLTYVSLDVEIAVQDWEANLIQIVEW